jgi:hypothetical protein
MERLIGAWKLVSIEDRLPGGEVSYPYGKEAVGLLVYDASGRMSVQIMRRDRQAFSSGEWSQTPAEEIKSAVEGFTAFFGSYEVDEAEKTVTHNVEGHLLPASVGKRLKRAFEFSNNRLILKPSETRRITWERIPPAQMMKDEG